MKYDVCIIGGLGHVGLPLGIVLAQGGAQVALYDLNGEARAVVRGGRMPFVEAGAEQALASVIGKTLHVVDAAAEADHTIITVGTPIDEYMNPRTEVVFGAVLGLRNLRHVCLRSTVFPGTTRRLAKILAAYGEKVEVSFCPERILQGRALAELRELPQIVSGVTPQAETLAAGMFKQFMPGVRTVPATVDEAELAKLYLNAWRYVRFAAVNQFYEIATDLGVDYAGVRRAMAEGYPRGADMPGPGFAAGPCLLKDTMQLAATSPNGFPLGQAARLVNEGMPDFIVKRLGRAGGIVDHGVCGILGMAFKADIDDVRDSLGFKLRRQLEFAGMNVIVSDEHHVPSKTAGWVSKEELIERADVVIVGVPHSSYVGLKLRAGQMVIDPWGATVGGDRL